MTFKSEVDSWFYAVILFIALILLFSIYPVLISGDPSSVALGAGLPVLALGLPIWLLLGTRYTVTDDLLTIRSGPFRWTIPLAQIHSVKPSRSLLSGPALSINRLEIRYGDGRKVLVSPKNRRKFLSLIQQ